KRSNIVAALGTAAIAAAGVTLPLAAAQSQGNAETAKPAKPAKKGWGSSKQSESSEASASSQEGMFHGIWKSLGRVGAAAGGGTYSTNEEPHPVARGVARGAMSVSVLPLAAVLHQRWRNKRRAANRVAAGASSRAQHPAHGGPRLPASGALHV
ncbi:hypothetical protein CYMTET_35989, partial [Cymbomonas tetramitiformis]